MALVSIGRGGEGNITIQEVNCQGGPKSYIFLGVISLHEPGCAGNMGQRIRDEILTVQSKNGAKGGRPFPACLVSEVGTGLGPGHVRAEQLVLILDQVG